MDKGLKRILTLLIVGQVINLLLIFGLFYITIGLWEEVILKNEAIPSTDSPGNVGIQ